MVRLPCDRGLLHVIHDVDRIVEKRFGVGSCETNKQESKLEGEKKMR
jgi:hypothetical protein